MKIETCLCCKKLFVQSPEYREFCRACLIGKRDECAKILANPDSQDTSPSGQGSKTTSR